MNPYAPTLNLEEFGPNNMLSILKWECEHITHLPGRSFDFQVCFSENEDFNAVAYEIGDKAYSNISIASVMQMYHHVLLIMGRNELYGKSIKAEDDCNRGWRSKIERAGVA